MVKFALEDPLEYTRLFGTTQPLLQWFVTEMPELKFIFTDEKV